MDPQRTQCILFSYTLLKMSNFTLEVNSASLIEEFSLELVRCIEKIDNPNKDYGVRLKSSAANLIAMPPIRLKIKLKILSKILKPSINESSTILLCLFVFQV